MHIWLFKGYGFEAIAYGNSLDEASQKILAEYDDWHKEFYGRPSTLNIANIQDAIYADMSTETPFVIVYPNLDD